MIDVLCFFFFFNDTATTEIYTLSLHDALPICLLMSFILHHGWNSSDFPSTYVQLTCHLSNICEVRATPVIYLLFFQSCVGGQMRWQGYFWNALCISNWNHADESTEKRKVGHLNPWKKLEHKEKRCVELLNRQNIYLILIVHHALYVSIPEILLHVCLYINSSDFSIRLPAFQNV